MDMPLIWSFVALLTCVSYLMKVGRYYYLRVLDVLISPIFATCVPLVDCSSSNPFFQDEMDFCSTQWVSRAYVAYYSRSFGVECKLYD